MRNDRNKPFVYEVTDAGRTYLRGDSEMVTLELNHRGDVLYVKLAEGQVASADALAYNLVVDLDKYGKVLGLKLLLPEHIDAEIKRQIAKLASSVAD